MSVSEIIFMNVGIAIVLAAILTLVMLIPSRLGVQHPLNGKGRRRKLDRERAAIRDQQAPAAHRRGLRPIRDQP